ncbi:hypothetical protein FOA52_007825 [Chlamydomonas sp. UWO 241]|nr:hypothetical protein FOA52_007825 [Chlamydomonas sp. UWO 241]
MRPEDLLGYERIASGPTTNVVGNHMTQGAIDLVSAELAGLGDDRAAPPRWQQQATVRELVARQRAQRAARAGLPATRERGGGGAVPTVQQAPTVQQGPTIQRASAGAGTGQGAQTEEGAGSVADGVPVVTQVVARCSGPSSPPDIEALRASARQLLALRDVRPASMAAGSE